MGRSLFVRVSRVKGMQSLSNTGENYDKQSSITDATSFSMRFYIFACELGNISKFRTNLHSLNMIINYHTSPIFYLTMIKPKANIFTLVKFAILSLSKKETSLDFHHPAFLTTYP